MRALNRPFTRASARADQLERHRYAVNRHGASVYVDPIQGGVRQWQRHRNQQVRAAIVIVPLNEAHHRPTQILRSVLSAEQTLLDGAVHEAAPSLGGFTLWHPRH